MCGYTIRKMPIGAYLRAMDLIQEIPGELIGKCFPDMSIADIGQMLTNNSTEAIQLAISGLMQSAPRYLLDVLSTLLGVDRERLENDENIGISGLLQMLEVWAKLNDIANFTKAAKRMLHKVKQAMRQQTEKGAESQN